MSKVTYGVINDVARKIVKQYCVLGSFSPVDLPAGYTQVEYIQSSGTQYIDTGFVPDEKSSCEVVMDYAAVSNENCGLFGTAGADYKTSAFEGFFQNGKFYLNFGGASTTLSCSVLAGDRLVMKVSQSEVSVSIAGTRLSAAPSAQSFTSPATFVLHALNRSGKIEYYSASRSYACRLWDDGTLVRNLIPCIDPSGAVGLYDLVNGVFYGNAGTGVFTAGPSTVKGITHEIKKSYVVAPNFDLAALPAGYTQVEYIQSSGTQYIDMGFKATGSTKILLDCEISYGSSWIMILGSYNSGAYYSWWGNGSNLNPYYGNANKTIKGPTGRTMLISDGANWSAGGNTAAFTAASFTAGSNAYLFTINGGGNYTKASMKVYGCQVFENGAAIRDFVPCINSSGAAGLYDLINGVFYGNIGTGAFTAGESYRERITRLCYEEEEPATPPTPAFFISYTGAYTSGAVIVDGAQRTLYTLTGSGTLVIGGELNAEIWMCSGGCSGSDYYSALFPHIGGPGGKRYTGTISPGTWVVTIGAGGTVQNSNYGDWNACNPGGATTAAGTRTLVASAPSASNGGTGAGKAYFLDKGMIGWNGDGTSKIPFGIISLKAHCPGGGGGGTIVYMNNESGTHIPQEPIAIYNGGDGGTNGGNGGEYSTSSTRTGAGGKGGEYGGGTGASITAKDSPSNSTSTDGTAGSFYGAGGGGGTVKLYYREDDNSYSSQRGAFPKAGYQGVAYILI